VAEKNIQMKRKLADGTFDEYFPKTKASNVIISDTDNRFLSADVEGALAEINLNFMRNRGDISSNTDDWNVYTTPGNYKVGLASPFNSTYNQPVGMYNYGVLVVHQSGNGTTQVYYPHSSDQGFAVRAKFNATDWQPWQIYRSHRSMNTVPGLAVAPSAAQSIPSNTWTKLAYGNVQKDNKGEFDRTTNRVTFKEDGWYLVTASVGFNNTADNSKHIVRLYINGTQSHAVAEQYAGATTGLIVNGSVLLYIAATEYLEVFAYSSTATALSADSTNMRLRIVKVA
jgi:hypothetical protein